MKKELQIDTSYERLLEGVGKLLQKGRSKAFQSVNSILVETYWQIGGYIVEYEQGGEAKAVYGTALLKTLSKDLKQRFGRGFSRSNLQSMRLIYEKYPKRQTLSGKLSWSVYCELLSISDDLARQFYEKQCINENWSVRTLKRQIKSGLFERVALSKDKKGVLELAETGMALESANDIIKDPYVFEFLESPEKAVLTEKNLENQLVGKLAQFLLELGKGFTFVGQQVRVTIDNTHYYVDLVFYHRILKCFVLIDLKRGKVSHQDIGQMNLYLNYYKHEENVENDNEPIGIVLAADKNEILVEYALGGITNQLFVSRYLLYLPDKELLEQELISLIERTQDK